MIRTINPATGEVLNTFPFMPFFEVKKILNALHKDQKKWSVTPLKIRSQKLLDVAALLRSKKKEYAKCIALEMGKPITAAIAEIEKCAWVCEFYAKEAESYLSSRMIETDHSKSEVLYQPLGIIFAIMPWNFPFWQVFRCAAPNVMAGNAIILSHAPIVTQCALDIEKIFLESDVPVFKTVIVNHETAADIIHHHSIAAVTLTGSERAGKKIGAEAGRALKKVVLELGGSDPYIILDDADLDNAAENIVKSRMNNTGQVCIAAKRIIAVEAIYNTLKNKILEKLDIYQMGDPLHPETMLGPIAREDLRMLVHEQVIKSVEKGAILLRGGEIPNRKGFYYPATVLDNVTPDMPAFEDEIFGPVISLIKARSEEEALSLANQTRFGLASAVFTNDIKKAKFFAKALEAGTCYINGLVSSDPQLPFGGIKSSGYGRELSVEGIREFTNIKTITIIK